MTKRKDCKKCMKIVKDMVGNYKETGVDMKKLKGWIEKNYGKKCKIFNPFCIACTTWRIYEDLKEMLII